MVSEWVVKKIRELICEEEGLQKQVTDIMFVIGDLAFQAHRNNGGDWDKFCRDNFFDLHKLLDCAQLKLKHQELLDAGHGTHWADEFRKIITEMTASARKGQHSFQE